MTSPGPIVDFGSPPVVETVLAVAFRELPELNAGRIGQFWTSQLLSSLPNVAVQGPYAVPIERFGDPRHGPDFEVSLSPGFPTPRMWFSNETGDLVQLQSNWIAYNWRGESADRNYQRYASSRQKLLRYLQALTEFCNEHNIGKIQPIQCEVSYFNRIPLAEEDADAAPFGRVIRGVEPQGKGFLPKPELGQLAIAYPITVQQDPKPIGRLHVKVANITDAGGSQVHLDLTARGRPLAEEESAAFEFLDLGRSWVVQGFRDITTDEMHSRWRLMTDESVGLI